MNSESRVATWRVASLLLGSGSCALIYQVVWLREFRLIFGGSTAASAAVLAIFIGGLGVGGLLLGSRADSHSRPLLLYSRLETIVAVSAAISPFLLALVREWYVAIGGTPRLGLVLGTVVRLVLSALVLAVPTIAMGGTLSAAARGITRQSDVRRQDVAALYALNTLGGVIGCVISTFFLLELFGTHQTLWLAAAVNLLVAMFARQLDRSFGALVDVAPTSSSADSSDRATATGFALVASAVVGFAFFLMELVWYRMLGPLLGGSVFTFGLILAVALVGIGLGGLLYTLSGRERPASLAGFAWSCLLEAAAMAGAYALGDRLAILALVLQPLGLASFTAHVAGWTAVTAIVVLPAAIVAGYQFPMLIALFGRGRERVGGQIGLAYAANTAGAIVGSLAGGFGLLPWLTAPGAWRFATLSLIVLGATASVLSVSRRPTRWIAQAALAATTLALLMTSGPTAAWRHTGIGAGRAGIMTLGSANQLKDWSNAARRAVVWEGDGTESSVALSRDATGYAFVVNGKTDGSARRDAGTQVMSGLLGAILNPKARRSLVIGLGTGSTAGWLGAIPSMDRVDVVELEPLILEVARACRDVNRDAMSNPKVHVMLGDAREMLLTSRDQYDVISSEPSNPFRAGIASLFTREYYLAASDHLSSDGIFIQWLQGYEIDSRTMRTVFATLASAFPYVETWQTNLGDLVLVAAKHPLAYRSTELAAKIQEEPFKSALLSAWRAVDLEGFFAHYVANDELTRAIAGAPGIDLNTDDRNVVEFGLARSVGKTASPLIADLRQLARSRHADRPPLDNPAAVNWPAVDTAWVSYQASEASAASDLTSVPANPAEDARRAALVNYYLQGNASAAPRAWNGESPQTRDPNELVMLSDLAAQRGSDEETIPLIAQLDTFNRGEAATLLAVLRYRQSRFEDAAAALEDAFADFRVKPWALLRVKQQAVDLAGNVGSRSPALARRMFEALREPFVAGALYEQRLLTRARLSRAIDFHRDCPGVMEALDVYPRWTDAFLSSRVACYQGIGGSRLRNAERDLREFKSREALPLGAGVADTRR